MRSKEGGNSLVPAPFGHPSSKFSALRPHPERHTGATKSQNDKPNSQQPRAADATNDKEMIAPADPAALRARLKHRAPPPTTTTGTSTSVAAPDTYTSSYDKVLDTARRLAELERQRAQDAAYIRTLEQARGTLQREAASVGRERARAERAEERVRALEGLLGEARERVGVLEGSLEGERRRREEWESGLEALALGGGGGGGGTGGGRW